jgi:CRISPR-associated endonuclease Csn1
MAKEKKNYRLGIDMGSTSLGWCMLELDQDNSPQGIINMGVRIFPDGREMQKHEPLSVKRRGFRGQRRNLDRYLLRVRRLISYLLENGFLPDDQCERDDVFKKNPYELRARALDENLEPAEFARALIHLAKRRGFRSNRKVLSDKETKISEAISNLREALQKEKARTLGEYLWNLYNETPEKMSHKRKPIKFRYEKTYENPIFPTREMVEDEFAKIWGSQARFSPLFTEERKRDIHQIIFHQRPLKPAKKGKCLFEPEEERAPKAHPLFQEFRIRQSLNNMKVTETFTGETFPLTDEQYEKLFSLLAYPAKEKITFAAMRREIFGKEARDYRFNLEGTKEKDLYGDRTHFIIHKPENSDIAPIWDALPLDKKIRAIEIIISDLDDEPAAKELMEAGVSEDLARRFLQLDLKDDYCNLSAKALQKLLPFMRQRQIYSDACASAGYKHSEEYNGEVFTDGDLPYYGEILRHETLELARESGDTEADEHGKINNPTVHMALNQLRKLVNSLCARYGPPRQIVLEVGKDAPLGTDGRRDLDKAMRKNQDLNDMIREFLAEHGQRDTAENRLRVKLWWELGDDEIDRRCVYSGHQISVSDLFSRKIEIDHILPKSRTYDDTTANKVLCTHEANQFKGERSPFEAFHDSPAGYDWQAILSRAQKLGRDSQKWKFNEDAMDRFDEENELIGRMLNDTRYMSRAAMKYMWYVCGKNNVWTVTGRHTGLLRGKWGLNSALGETASKERDDHRHHAIDAFVIGMTSRGLVKKVAQSIRDSEYRFLEKLPPPWQGFDHGEFRRMVGSIAVSIKSDHIDPNKLAARNQTGGALMEETSYGWVKGPDCGPMPDPDNPKNRLYTARKTIDKLTPKNIRDVIRADLRRELEDIAATRKGKEFTEAVKAWAERNNVKKVKVALSMNPAGMIPVRDKTGRVFKYMASGENLFAELYLADPADSACKWAIEIVNSYNAHQPGFVPQWKKDHPKGKKIMRIYKNDVIALDGESGGRELRRVKKMDKAKGILYLRELNVAKKEKNNEDIGEQFSPRQLMGKRARKAGVDVMGRVHDPVVKEK